MRCLSFILLGLGWMMMNGLAATTPTPRVGEGVVLKPVLATQVPHMDGVLDDPVWQGPPQVAGPFITNNPVYGETLPQKTEVWIAYDPDFLYFAFYCHDDQPDKIKATVTRRDTLFSEDWVGVDIDAMGNRQFTLEHLCNPLGIQADIFNSASSGESIEPDWVWKSAGRLVMDGYIVEMAIPLKSIKFKSGENVTMNLAFYRFVSRTSANASWPEISQQQGYFNSLAPATFTKLNKQLRLELLPAFTYGNIWDRETPDKWSKGDSSTQLGIGIKYGLTSSINAEITINPDFSQVESDEFQIEANQRFPLFYSEKRPFFMEVGNLFSLAGFNGDMNMNTAVHTRSIVDPAWGAKLTGDAGKITFGLLVAGDEFPGREWEDEPNPFLGKNATFTIGRFKYSLKGENYIGLLYSGREFHSEYNRVIAGDFHFRLKGNHIFSGNGLYSFSKDPDTLLETKAGAVNFTYDYNQKPLGISIFFEHMGPSFRMDSAFYSQTGITALTAYVGPNIYPNKQKLPWLKKINVFVYGFVNHHSPSDKTDLFGLTGIRFNFIKQGFLRLDYRHHKESWLGQYFKQNKLTLNGSVQLMSWLGIGVYLVGGDKIYYNSPLNPFLGNQFLSRIEVNVQPNSNFTQNFIYLHEAFFDKTTKVTIYDLDILISRTTYQFNKYLFVRGLVQYDSYSKRILTDLLTSFTLIPGTVVHLGYGSLHQKLYWNNNLQTWENDLPANHYYQMRQSFFFKVSYLYRF